MMKTTLFFLTLLISTLSFGQNMKSGFTLLENGKYAQAKTFFADVLKEYPENKTARLCYGRALGLSGSPAEATQLFTDLQEDYPRDYEVGLNYAESLLWGKNYDAAEEAYIKLVETDSTNFSALLGYANTLSNLKEYDQALKFVNKALAVQNNNPNALVSRKYMRLGKAGALSDAYAFEKAISTLEKNLLDFENDEITLKALANTYIAQKNYSQAFEAYGKLKDSVQVLTGQALVAHLDKNDKKALILATRARDLQPKDSIQTLQAYERYVQALIWNGKYKTTRNALSDLDSLYGKNVKIAALKASLGMYTGTFKTSIDQYEYILAKDSTSFDGNLGIANAYRAQGNLEPSFEFAQETIGYYPGQKDALGLIKTINNTLSPIVQTRAAYTKDNGDNQAYAAGINILIPFSYRFRTTFSYDYRSTENKIFKVMAKNTNVNLGAHYRVYNNTWIEGTVGFVKADAATNSYTDVNGSVFLKSRPLPLQYLELGYSRELQNFNAELIDKKIFMNNYMLNYNMGTNVNLGWYTGLTHTTQTDGNTRNLLFTSLYYTFTKSPALKGGINYQYLSFKDQVPTVYFSPERYQAVEVFLDLSGNFKKWSYAANAAGGYQYVEKDAATTLFRLEANIKYSIFERFEAGSYAKYSNVASATAAGFEFTEVGFKLRWQILQKPVFQL